MTSISNIGNSSSQREINYSNSEAAPRAPRTFTMIGMNDKEVMSPKARKLARQKSTKAISGLAKLEEGFSRTKADQKLLNKASKKAPQKIEENGVIPEEMEESSPGLPRESQSIRTIQKDEIDEGKSHSKNLSVSIEKKVSEQAEKTSAERKAEFFYTRFKYTKSLEFKGLRKEKMYKNVKWIIFPDDKFVKFWISIQFMYFSL